MGWGRFLLLGNLGQQFDLSDQKRDLDRLNARIDQTREATVDWRREVNRLQRENDQLKLYLAAVSRLLAGKGVLTKAEIEAMVSQIDVEDGQVDGRQAGPL